MRKITLSLTLLLWMHAAQTAGAAASVQKAKQLFQRYTALGAAFDPAVADLYSDQAVIRNTRRFPDGQTRVMTIPAASYKELIRSAMPMAKAKGDRNRFSNVQYKAEGSRVRIRATRYSLLKKYSSPLSLLVGPDKSGKWVIYEEISESRP